MPSFTFCESVVRGDCYRTIFPAGKQFITIGAGGAFAVCGSGSIRHCVRQTLRRKIGRESEPSAAATDSQSIKTTECGGLHGYDGSKNISGRKRHLLADTVSLLLEAKVHTADILDNKGGKLLLEKLNEKFPRTRHCRTDMDYRGDFPAWCKENPVGRLKSLNVRAVGSVEPLPHFTILKRRWAVERALAWIGRYIRMSKDYKFLPETGKSFIYAAMSRLRLKRLTKHIEKSAI